MEGWALASFTIRNLDDAALAGDILKKCPAAVLRARFATVFRTNVRADTVKDLVHSGKPPTVASASRFCSSVER